MSQEKTTPPSQAFVTPQTQIALAIDTAYVIGQKGPATKSGKKVFMMDNHRSQNSTDEGGDELSTVCKVGDTISWYVVPLDPTTGHTVEIYDWKFYDESQSYNIFGIPQDKPQKDPNYPSYWLGVLQKPSMNQKVCYNLYINIHYGNGQVYPFTWDPFLIVNP
ncbi:inclusion body family protein [Chitinophaga pendula]|uniref:hypothetical protein n=1 Tax=Chitinophaga TaxID=79328 RepID=UPI000BB00EFA|nr:MULTISPECIES: hypothetical protein [Chitinophaga]ASZ14253.1 hypothetical protein CK934_26550 [Chitinophaga sp. MD30]UCJ08103.1 inclusion body family protein [Chitinophaga pendula]